MIDPALSLLLQNTPGNFIERICNLEVAVQELQLAESPGIEELQRDDVRVIDLDLFPAAGVIVTDPTSVEYIGGFISGEGLAFGADTWNFGGVNAGVIQVGINTVDGTLYAINANIAGVITIGAGSTAGGWIIDSDSIHDAASFVGLSSAVTGGNDLRIWAGSATPASAAFRVYEDGSMVASKGSIGGWTINATNIIDTAGLVGISSAVTGGDDVRFWAGNVTPTSAPFRVTEAGVVTASSGTVGGWTLGANVLQDTAGLTGMSSAVTGGDDIRFWAGNATPASAAFQVKESGAVVASSITISGASTIAGWSIDSTRIYKLTANVGVALDSSIPGIKIGDNAGTYIFLDGANQRIRSSNYVAGLIGSNWATSTGNAEFNNITVRGAIAVTTIQYGYVTAHGGTDWIVPATGVLRDDCTSVNSPTTFAVNVKDPDGMSHAAAGSQWTVGDIIRMKEPLTGDLWASISSKTDNTTYWTLNVVKQSPGAGTNYTFRAGLAIIDYGVSGSGFISLSADTQMGATPNITLGTHAGSPWTTTTNLVRIGNLNGGYGYVSNVYGVGMGSYGVAGQPSLTVDTTNGIRIISNTTVVGQWDASGNIVVGQVAASQSNILISSGGISIRNNTTERIGMTSAGVLTIKDSGGNAVLTFDASTGAEITKKLTMSGVNAAIAIGAIPPTSSTVGTGIWIDRNGVYSLSASTQNATLTSAGLSAGGGKFTATSTGVTFVVPTSYADENSIKFQTSAGVNAGLLYVFDSGSLSQMVLRLDTSTFGSNRAYGNNLQIIAFSKTGQDSVAEIVAGGNPGASVSGNLKITRSGAGQSTIEFNTDGNDFDFSVKTLGGTQSLFVQGSDGAVTLGNTLNVTGISTFSANPVVSNTAPGMVFTDTTASAKGLTITVDANKADFRESAGAAASLLQLDLTNNRVGVAMSAAKTLDVTGTFGVTGHVTMEGITSTGATGTGKFVFDTAPTFPTTITVTGAATFNGAVTLGDAAADTITFNGTPAGLIVAGTYTPTLFNTTNVAGSTAYLCQYMRVGSTVTVSGRVDIDPTAAGAVLMGMSLPITSSFANPQNCAGCASAVAVASQSAGIDADTANPRAQFRWVAVDTANRAMMFTFTYQIM